MTTARANYELRAQDKTKASFDSVKKNLQATKAQIVGFNRGFAAIAGAGGLGLTLSSALDTTNELRNLGIRLNLSTEFLSKMRLAAESTGVSFQTAATAIQRLQRRTAEAVAGNKGLREAFATLNIDVDKFNKLTNEDQFLVYAEAISRVEDQGKRLSTNFKLLDTEGAALLQTFNDGAAGLHKYFEEAKRVNAVVGQDTVNATNSANETIASLKGSMRGFMADFGSTFGPLVSGVIKAVTGVLRGLFGTLREGLGYLKSGFEFVRDKILGFIPDEAKQKISGYTDELKGMLQTARDLPVIGNYVRQFTDDADGAVKQSVDKVKKQLEQVSGVDTFEKDLDDSLAIVKNFRALLALKEQDRQRQFGTRFDRNRDIFGLPETGLSRLNNALDNADQKLQQAKILKRLDKLINLEERKQTQGLVFV